jgi:O-antigen biosynthesis protein
VAPLRYGAGVKGKVNQSMAFGVPVVATPVAVEGMDLQHRINVLVADNPKAFGDAVVELYQSEELWQKIAKNGIQRTIESFSVEAARKQLERLLSTDHVMPYEGHAVHDALRTDSPVLIQG